MSTRTHAAGMITIAPGTTPEETVRSAATAVQKTGFTDQVEYLLTTVGPRITATGAGLQDGRQLVVWRKGEEPRESLKSDRVAAMAEVTAAIMTEYTAAVAASFLRSSQPALDDRSPVVMIREASTDSLPEVMKQVRGVVRAFLEG